MNFRPLHYYCLDIWELVVENRLKARFSAVSALAFSFCKVFHFCNPILLINFLFFLAKTNGRFQNLIYISLFYPHTEKIVADFNASLAYLFNVNEIKSVTLSEL